MWEFAKHFFDHDQTQNLCWKTCLALDLYQSWWFEFENESWKAKVDWLIKCNIMHIFNEAEPPQFNLSEILGQ